MLRKCKLCGELYDDKNNFRTKKICRNCMMKLEGTYSRAHNYLRDHESLRMNFDALHLANELEVDVAEIQILVELGYLERDIQTYAGSASKRQELAEEFSGELSRMIERNKITTYGGEKYKRKL